MVPCPYSPNRFSALAISCLTSFTVALTADSCTKTFEVDWAISLAIEVFPVPGGPQRITDESLSFSMRLLKGFEGPSKCVCPTTSSRVCGRSLSARGALRSKSLWAEDLNKSFSTL